MSNILSITQPTGCSICCSYPCTCPRVVVLSGHRNALADPVNLRHLAEDYPEAEFRHGGAPGFDEQADRELRAFGIKPGVWRPDYRKEPAADSPDRWPLLWTEQYRARQVPWVKVAPLKRNEGMIDGIGRAVRPVQPRSEVPYTPAGLVVVLWDGRQTGGTWYTREFARWRGVEVREWSPVSFRSPRADADPERVDRERGERLRGLFEEKP
jgi:hypothetical protein